MRYHRVNEPLYHATQTESDKVITQYLASSSCTTLRTHGAFSQFNIIRRSRATKLSGAILYLSRGLWLEAKRYGFTKLTRTSSFLSLLPFEFIFIRPRHLLTKNPVLPPPSNPYSKLFRVANQNQTYHPPIHEHQTQHTNGKRQSYRYHKPGGIKRAR